MELYFNSKRAYSCNNATIFKYLNKQHINKIYNF